MAWWPTVLGSSGDRRTSLARGKLVQGTGVLLDWCPEAHTRNENNPKDLSDRRGDITSHVEFDGSRVAGRLQGLRFEQRMNHSIFLISGGMLMSPVGEGHIAGLAGVRKTGYTYLLTRN